MDSVTTDASFDALTHCDFFDASFDIIDPVTIVSAGSGVLVFGPPQVILGVQCNSTSRA